MAETIDAQYEGRQIINLNIDPSQELDDDVKVFFDIDLNASVSQPSTPVDRQLSDLFTPPSKKRKLEEPPPTLSQDLTLSITWDKHASPVESVEPRELFPSTTSETTTSDFYKLSDLLQHIYDDRNPSPKEVKSRPVIPQSFFKTCPTRTCDLDALNCAYTVNSAEKQIEFVCRCRTKSYGCVVCGERFSLQEYVMNHFHREHDKLKECPHCEKKTKKMWDHAFEHFDPNVTKRSMEQIFYDSRKKMKMKWLKEDFKDLVMKFNNEWGEKEKTVNVPAKWPLKKQSKGCEKELEEEIEKLFEMYKEGSGTKENIEEIREIFDELLDEIAHRKFPGKPHKGSWQRVFWCARHMGIQSHILGAATRRMKEIMNAQVKKSK